MVFDWNKKPSGMKASSIGHILEKEGGSLNAHGVMYLVENYYEATLNKRYFLTCNTHAHCRCIYCFQLKSILILNLCFVWSAVDSDVIKM